MSELEFEVRDYECDLQGIVNNAVYQNYLEHARHVVLKRHGIDFAELSGRGINLVVVRIEIDYLRSLQSGDRFVVTVALEPVSRVRFGIRQEIRKLPGGEPVARAWVIATGLNTGGRPGLPPEIVRLVEEQSRSTD